MMFINVGIGDLRGRFSITRSSIPLTVNGRKDFKGGSVFDVLTGIPALLASILGWPAGRRFSDMTAS